MTKFFEDEDEDVKEWWDAEEDGEADEDDEGRRRTGRILGNNEDWT